MTRLALAIALLPTLAGAEPLCAPHDALQTALALEWGETRHAAMIGADGALWELWGAKGGTWTLTRTEPGGPTCILMAGVAFDPAILPLIAGDPA